MRLRSKEVRVPYTQEATQDRDVLLKRRFFEMLVHSLGARKEFVEIIKTNVQSNTQPNGTPDAISPANPAFEAEHVLLIDAKLGHLGFVGGEGNEVLCDVLLVSSRLQEPLLGGIGIGSCLGGGKGFGRHETQCRFRIRVTQRLSDMGTINVGNKV